MAVRAIFFDIGETLIDETRQWGAWADWLGISRLTFFAALGSVIERGEHHRRVFDLFRDEFDVERARQELALTHGPLSPRADDFYPDAVPCLRELRSRGYFVGLAGNQPAAAEDALKSINLPIDFVASSERMGVEKPAEEFFVRLGHIAGMPLGEIAYVGDRLDNDVMPALRIGIRAVFMRRGPWAFIQGRRPEAKQVHLRLDTLADLPDLIRGL